MHTAENPRVPRIRRLACRNHCWWKPLPDKYSLLLRATEHGLVHLVALRAVSLAKEANANIFSRKSSGVICSPLGHLMVAHLKRHPEKKMTAPRCNQSPESGRSYPPKQRGQIT